MKNAEFDLVVFGATGFTGTQTAHYVDQHAESSLEWAIAGRNPDKLDALANSLNGDPGIIVADALDQDATREMVGRTRLVCSTAGPYARYGNHIVDACAELGVDYCDITGETPWVRDVIDRCHDQAVESGARIVPFCGFDSVPSDLGAWFVVREIRRRLEQPTASVKAYFQGSGGFNGGTLATLLNLFEQDEVERLRDPVLLNPPDARDREHRADNEDQSTAVFDSAMGRWTAPFFMAPINTRVVRRSAALAEASGDDWGARFRYNESMLMPRKLGHAMGLGISAGMAILERTAGFAPVRSVLERLGPGPGEGPSQAVMDAGWVKVRYLGTAEDGRTLRAEMSAKGDPGNRFTVKVLCESAFCLLSDELSEGGGVLTPSAAMGECLLNRLRAAGVTIEVTE